MCIGIIRTMNKKMWYRILYVVIGLTIVSIGLAFVRYAVLGVDPFITLVTGITRQIGLSFGTTHLLVFLVMLIAVVIFDRGKIGFGTVYAMVVVGYSSDAVLWLIQMIPVFEQFSIQTRVASFVLGLAVLYFGVAIYIETNMGVSPYDAIGLIFVEKIKRPHWFRWARICTDALCVIGGALLQSDIGIGTVLTVLIAGPLIAFFRKMLARTKLFEIIQDGGNNGKA